MIDEKCKPCTKCGFDDSYITDYHEDGTEYDFCGNCGTPVSEKIKFYFAIEQLDELSRVYRTMPTDGEGYPIEPEYEGMIARGNIVKLVSDVKTARDALTEAQQEVKEWQEEAKQWRDEFVDKNNALGEAQQTIARQQKILKFYAAEENNSWWVGGLDEVVQSEVMKDEGRRARAELEGNKEGEI
ncbi:hypothetical protein [Paenibacillus wynnii]|uniref:Uncharacterized protein n=1 Tax=Paenibacillus wynnii TaxID=268407 RepID=A0A098MEW7_9BACL|nr:hypothetical protein [Paenibacillus wynnii]KGE18464.1 hypothetical protein PWYN_03070 [Paenibacillus wynnii]KGE20601.1 hypothetical protein PWYN_15550 [Paenibacillus wynnii]